MIMNLELCDYSLDCWNVLEFSEKKRFVHIKCMRNIYNKALFQQFPYTHWYL